MAQPANTFATNDAVGIREDLSDVIYNISPMEFPFMTAIGSGKPAKAIRTEWQVDELATAAFNTVIEGDDATLDAVTPTKRLNNTCQISDKTVVITGSMEAVDKAGRDSELAYQITKKTKELKRDIEFTLSQNQATAIGSDVAARSTASFETWIRTNQDRGAGGAASAATGEQPNDAAQPTDGTQRAFTEDMLKKVLADCWTQGGDPSLVIVGPFNKRVVSAFTGNASRMIQSEGKKLVTAIDVYVHDFGSVNVVPSRFSRDRTAMVVDPEFWDVAWLRPVGMWELAKTGDTHKRQILGEFALRAKQQKSSGVVADLTVS